MVKCIFSLGIVDKKLLIPLLNSLNYIVTNIYFHFYPEDDVNIFIYYIGFAIGEIMISLLPYIFKYKNKGKKEKKCTKSNIIDYLFMLLIDLFAIVAKNVTIYFSGDEINDINAMEGIEIIIIFFVTAFFFKYKYYIHHIISIAIFIILSIIIDIMLDNYKGHDISSLSANFLYLLFEAVGYCYFYYLLEIKYRHFWNVFLFLGIIDLIIYSFLFSTLLLIRSVNNNNNFLSKLELYKEGKIGYLIFRFLIGIFIGGFFGMILEIKTLSLFSINHIFVCTEISKISEILLNANNLNDWLSIIPFTLQIIILLFYLEIFEYNFCDLNKNTKRNIQLRERNESLNIDDMKGANIIELKHGYFIYDEDEKEHKKENEKEEIEEDNNLIPKEESN
jgi:hypothetical protein